MGGLYKGRCPVRTIMATFYTIRIRRFPDRQVLIGSISLSVILFCLALFSVSDIHQFRFGILSDISLVLPAGIMGCYAFANIFSSVMISYKHGFRYFFMLPIVFATLHFSYGLGSICGLLTLKKWIAKNKAATKALRV